MKKILTLTLMLAATWWALAQPLCQVRLLDEHDGLPHSHVTQLLQDADGLMWMATWNGLCCYDGYEFRTFKPMAGDGCHITTDRVRDIALRPDGNILCRIDDSYFLFDTHRYRFRGLTAGESRQAPEEMTRLRQSKTITSQHPIEWSDEYGTQWRLDADGHLYHQAEGAIASAYPLGMTIHPSTFALADPRGCLWLLGKDGVYLFTPGLCQTQRLPQQQTAEVKCLHADSHGRIWVTTREDATVRVYERDGTHLIGYLSDDGTLRQTYTRMSAPVYCIYETTDGTLWMGTKTGGILRLREAPGNRFTVDHLTDLPCLNVYDIRQDRHGRLWAATLGGGLCYATRPDAPSPHFATPRGYPTDGTSQRVRFMHFAQQGNVLMAATTDGLVVARMQDDADAMHFLRHQREADRTTSLSSSALMDILEDARGHIYVSTESGGVNLLEDADPLSETLHFKHFNTHSHHLTNDVVLSLTAMADGGILIVGNHQLCILGADGHTRSIDARRLGIGTRLSDAHPLLLDDGRWLLGIDDGAVLLPTSLLSPQQRTPRLLLTGAYVEGQPDDRVTQYTDTITLLPHERNLTLHFAAIDYIAGDRISYAFRLSKNTADEPWNYIGHDRSATLLDMEPGTYTMEIRCTDADGQWAEPTKKFTIIVQPTFWESAWGRLLIALIAISILSAITATIFYIRRIRRQQHETLEAYLALLHSTPTVDTATADKRSTAEPTPAPASTTPVNIKPEDDAMIKRVMAFIEENIGNSEVSIGDMASAAATSRSGLQRKLKQAMGITPQDLLREARIKHASMLLRETNRTVAEVAYASGFSDPKYFSRCFKASTGQSPTAYKGAQT